MKSKRSKILLSFIMLVYAIVIGGLLAAIIEVPEARLSTILLSGTPATTTASADCPDFTYVFAWNGDHSTNENLACTANGTGTDAWDATDGTDRVSDAIGADGDQEFAITGNDQYLSWTDGAGNIINNTAGTGTVWFSVNSVTQVATVPLFESVDAATNKMAVTIKTNLRVAGTWEGQDTQNGVDKATEVITDETWTRCAYTWNVGTSYHCVTCDAGWDTGTECENEAITAWESAPDKFNIGENQWGGGHSDTVYIDDVFVTQGYQSADPCTSGCKGQ